jgi:hypothetical protein
MKNPWDRQPRERSKAYGYFCQYRDLGEERSLEKLCQICTKTVPKISRLKELSSRWDWVERAEKYDEYLRLKERESKEKKISNFMDSDLEDAISQGEDIKLIVKKLGISAENGEVQITSIAHAMKSILSAYKDNMEVILRLAGLPQTITESQLNADIKADVKNTVEANTKVNLDEILIEMEKSKEPIEDDL